MGRRARGAVPVSAALDAFRLPSIAEQAQTLAELLASSARVERAAGHADDAARYQEAAAHAAAAALVLLPPEEESCPPTL